jgi:hypothetical protein
MTPERDAPRVLYELVQEPDLKKRIELHEELIPLLEADEDIKWTEAQTRLLRRQKTTQMARMVSTRASKFAKADRRKTIFKKAAQSEWRIRPKQSVNKVAMLLRKSQRNPPAESTLRAWIRDLKPR